MIINAFKKKIFPLNDASRYSEYNSEVVSTRSLSPGENIELISSPDLLPKRSSSSSSTGEFDKFLLDSEKDLDPSLVKKKFF